MAPLSYLVCATQRSGSTLLCELLTGTGVAGRARRVLRGPQGQRTRRPAAPVLRGAPTTRTSSSCCPRSSRRCRRSRGSSGSPPRASAARRPTASSARRSCGPTSTTSSPHGEPEDSRAAALRARRAPRQGRAGGLAVDGVQTAAVAREDRDAGGRAGLPRRRDRAPDGPARGARAAWRDWFAERGIEPLVSSTRTSRPTGAHDRAVLDHVGVPSDGVPVPGRRCAASPTAARRSGSTASASEVPA